MERAYVAELLRAQRRSVQVRDPPSPEREILLRLVATQGERERSRPEVDRLLDQADQRCLLQEAWNQRLLAVCGARLLEDHADKLDGSTKEAIDDGLRAAGPQATILDGVAEFVLAELDRCGIRALQVKGTALAQRVYGNVAMRPATDIDLLVYRSQLAQAVAALRERGYRNVPSPEVVEGLPELHYTLARSDPWLPPVELHWRVHWYDGGFSKAMLDRSMRGPGGAWYATPSDELASLLLFFARDGFIGLKYAADIATWWDVHGSNLGKDGLSRVATNPAIAPALRAAASVVEGLGGPTRAQLLPGAGELHPRESQAVRLTNWKIAGDHDQITANRALVDWLLRPSGSVRQFARRQLLPPAVTVAGMYGVPASARVRSRVLRIVHLVKIAVRLGLGRWSIRGGRGWTRLPQAVERIGASLETPRRDAQPHGGPGCTTR